MFAGCRSAGSSKKSFQDIGKIGYWWSSSEYSGYDFYGTGFGDCWQISKTEDNIKKYGWYDENGFSVRCIKD